MYSASSGEDEPLVGDEKNPFMLDVLRLLVVRVGVGAGVNAKGAVLKAMRSAEW
jgi:hypothetical protein